MPNIKSAKKRLRQNVVRKEQNRADKSRVRNSCKKVLKAVAAGKIEEAETLFREAVKFLDKNAAEGKILHKNTAARKKSRLSAVIKKAKASQTA
ncbi:MAG: 30S ribosomal protein S20 [Planctomycetaceae bacterium]|jgi:small subunit ribosomal protein S20|nr:30S ribosomal protein S20 [Planctomycetaceae bacterium]